MGSCAARLALAMTQLTCAHAQSGYSSCPGGFDATFIQLGERELDRDQAHWADDLALLQRVGVRLVVLQFSGDAHGSYDVRSRRAPVRALLEAAAAINMPLFLGLHADPRWPNSALEDHQMAPPLDDDRATRELAELCSSAPMCAGWYVSQEIDDQTWSTPERTAQLRAHLAGIRGRLERLGGRRPIAIAPFFTGRLDPAAHARWWREILADGSVDILILQDGIGVGRSSPSITRAYLTALREVTRAARVQLWSAIELFAQIHGPPIDDHEFAAIAMSPERLETSLAAQRPIAERLVAFSVLDYMHPERSETAGKLYRWYAPRCWNRAGFDDRASRTLTSIRSLP